MAKILTMKLLKKRNKNMLQNFSGSFVLGQFHDENKRFQSVKSVKIGIVTFILLAHAKRPE